MNQGCGNAGCTGLCQVWGLLNGENYPSGPSSGLNLFPDLFVAEKRCDGACGRVLMLRMPL
jgi:hypothetical protein